MSTLKNTVRLIGHLGQDPVIRNLDKGVKMARFSLATSDTYKGKDGQLHEETQWHNLVAWGRRAGVCETSLHKGKKVAVEGKLTYRNWQTNEGSQCLCTEIVVNEILLIDYTLSS